MRMFRNFVKVVSLRVLAALAPVGAQFRASRGGGNGGGIVFPDVHGEAASLDFRRSTVPLNSHVPAGSHCPVF